jgi:hypothetical protein
MNFQEIDKMQIGDYCRFTIKRSILMRSQGLDAPPEISEEEITLDGMVVGLDGKKVNVLSGKTVYRVDASTVQCPTSP